MTKQRRQRAKRTKARKPNTSPASGNGIVGATIIALASMSLRLSANEIAECVGNRDFKGAVRKMDATVKGMMATLSVIQDLGRG